MCLNVKSQGTCAKPFGEAPLAYRLLDVRLRKDISMISIIGTLSINVTASKICTIFKMILSRCDIHDNYDYVSYAHLNDC